MVENKNIREKVDFLHRLVEHAATFDKDGNLVEKDENTDKK
jgi:hypothetical protein